MFALALINLNKVAGEQCAEEASVVMERQVEYASGEKRAI